MPNALRINAATGETELVQVDLPPAPAPDATAEQARAALRAVGLTDEQIDALLEAAR